MQGRSRRAALIPAALAWQFDRHAGIQHFATARKYLEKAGMPVRDAAIVAYYDRVVDPGTSRLQLEAAFFRATRHPSKRENRYLPVTIALAMAPLDFSRAVEMARAIPTVPNPDAHFDALRKLAQFAGALGDVAKRYRSNAGPRRIAGCPEYAE